MTRSAYATVSVRTVTCPTCHAIVTAPCRTLPKDASHVPITLKRCHSARRKAADAARTEEVRRKLLEAIDA